MHGNTAAVDGNLAGHSPISRQPAGDPLHEIVNFNALLLHRVAIPQGHRILELRAFFSQCLKINRDTPWCAQFVLVSITLADITTIIPLSDDVLLQQVENRPCFFDQRRFVS